MKLTDAEVNHLRRLLGWVRCEAGSTPEEICNALVQIAPTLNCQVDNGGKQRITEWYEKSVSVPKYVRAAIKSLEEALRGEREECAATFSPIALEHDNKSQKLLGSEAGGVE